MNALHHAFRNSQGFVTTLEPPLVVTPFNHTRLTVKYSANRLLTQGPKSANSDTEKCLSKEASGEGCWKELKEKFDSLTGSFLACIRTSCSAIRKSESYGQPKLGTQKILPKTTPKYRKPSKSPNPLYVVHDLREITEMMAIAYAFNVRVVELKSRGAL
jgi:hypothetical protein